MLKKTYKILNIFAKNPTLKFLFKDIKGLSKNKSGSYTYNTLKNFVKADILIQEKIGNILLYSVNNNSKAAAYLAIASEYEAWNKKQIPYKDIENLISKIPTNLFTLLITGSYAENNQTKRSDIDVVIISAIEPKKIYAELKHHCEMNIPPIHLYVFTEKEFLQMLLDKKPNYGKETAKNNLILFGSESYYKIIFEAMRNGFTG